MSIMIRITLTETFLQSAVMAKTQYKDNETLQCERHFANPELGCNGICSSITLEKNENKIKNVHLFFIILRSLNGNLLVNTLYSSEN